MGSCSRPAGPAVRRSLPRATITTNVPSSTVVTTSKTTLRTIARRYPDSMKPKKGVYSLINRLTSPPAAIPIPARAAETRIRSPTSRPSRRTGAISTTPTTPVPMKLSRKRVPIVGTT
jgi:hypothetical protein